MSANVFTQNAEEIQKVEERLSSASNYGSTPVQATVVDGKKVHGNDYISIQGDNFSVNDNQQLVDSDKHDVEYRNFTLFQDEAHPKPLVSEVINRLANYEGGVVPHLDSEDAAKSGKGGQSADSSDQAKAHKLGTLLGVYFPCIQNIFGIILFVRLAWAVGTAGCIESFFVVFMCCCSTMTTALSMSAVATNGVVASGGSYFMISRALGPEFGGAVGVLFYLGNAVASSMYIVGATEIFLQYMVPQASIFGDLSVPANAYNNIRVYGTMLFIVMFIWVLLGVKYVSKFSVVVLFCVIVSILCVYIGIFVASPSRGPTICLLGDRLIARDKIWNSETKSIECNKNSTGMLFQMYCFNMTNIQETTDPYCSYFRDHPAVEKPGLPGLASGIFSENAYSRYSGKGDRIGSWDEGDRSKGDIIADITTSFVIFIGIMFPAVTGIMAGSNRSGDLADPQKSIPIGTLLAVLTTSLIYFTFILLIAGSVDGHLLRDKFGESIGGGLLLAYLSWPSKWVILIGSCLSTIGAGLQSLVGAPRLLQAISADRVIPFLNVFSVTSKGEPMRALLLTGTIVEAGILVANIDNLAPVISIFFLMCYAFVNIACTLQTILRMPNWRPRFKYYHWLLSLFGACLCLVMMFLISWYYAIVVIVIAATIYKYIEFKGAEKEWGDGMRGLAMSAARFALTRLEEGPPHVKNWRPQLLILLQLDDNLEPRQKKLLTFCSQLKEGKGLTLVGSVLEGEYADRYADAQAAKQTIMEVLKKEKTRAFVEVIVTDRVVQGISYLIQGAGVGGLTHNTVVLNWPEKYRHAEDERSYRIFISTLRNIHNGQLAALITKGIDQFPENTDKLVGTIDIWWIVHDGGLLMLIPFLLIQHKVWKNCVMRIFTVAQISNRVEFNEMEDNKEQITKDIQMFLYHLRLPAEVQVVQLPASAISAYTYERALMMEQRNVMMQEIRKKKKVPNAPLG